jgi:hypothetical protein
MRASRVHIPLTSGNVGGLIDSSNRTFEVVVNDVHVTVTTNVVNFGSANTAVAAAVNAGLTFIQPLIGGLVITCTWDAGNSWFRFSATSKFGLDFTAMNSTGTILGYGRAYRAPATLHTGNIQPDFSTFAPLTDEQFLYVTTVSVYAIGIGAAIAALNSDPRGVVIAIPISEIADYTEPELIQFQSIVASQFSKDAADGPSTMTLNIEFPSGIRIVDTTPPTHWWIKAQFLIGETVTNTVRVI